MDLGSVDAVIRYCAQLEEPVDVLVNNAGLNVLAELDAIQPQQWNEMVQVDLAAPLLLAQCLAPGMKRRGWGRILNISSIFSMVSKERRLAYSSVKAGLNGMTRALALELAPFHVLVNAICPGYVETDMTRANNTADDLAAIARLIPLGRLARPEEIAQVAAFLCSEENTYLTGQCLAVDGGFLLR
jgi:3-oxoacyl-[acyl-carrier protein] reductase